MTQVRVALSRIGAMFLRGRRDRALEEELATHLEMLAEENMRRGMSSKEAWNAARREFGAVTHIKEEYREARGVPWVENAARDVRYAVRLLRKSPGFASAAVAVVALGIGASTIVYSARSSIFFRILPYAAPERLAAVGEISVKNGRPGAFGQVRYPDFADWRSQNRVFEDMAAWRTEQFNVNLGPEAVRLSGDRVSEGFFPVLGTRPALGRWLVKSDFAAGAPPVAVLSHSWWVSAFGSRGGIVGETVRIGGRPVAVVGVMPPGYRSPALLGNSKFWIPLAATAAEMDRNNASVAVFGRLRPGASIERARGDMSALARRLEEQYPDSNRELGARVELLPDRFSAGANSNLILVLGIASTFVLLIGCANLANLLLARGVERRKEIALRMSLGAGRARLLCQFVTESLLVALAGGAAGLLVAYRAMDAISGAIRPLLESAGVERLEVSGRVLGFALALSAGTALLFGLFSALSISRVDLSRALNEGSRAASAPRSRRRLTRALVVSELTFALMLLVSAAFVVRSVYWFWRLDWGFPLDHRIALTVSLPEATHGAEAQRTNYFREALQRTRALPGIRSAALVSSLPIDMAAPASPVKVALPAGTSLSTAAFRAVSAEYLATLSVPLVRGRGFTEQDSKEGVPVAIINAAMARRFWSAGDPVGTRVEIGGRWRTVVGVAGDILNQGLFSRPGYEVLVPYAQSAPASMMLVAHTAGEPGPMLARAKEAVRSVDPDQPISGLTTLEGMHADLAKGFAVVVVPLFVFGASALLLATVGIYSVISYSVSSRTREIGIRMALGASRARVVMQNLREGARLVALGLCLGGVGGFLLTRLLTSRVWWLKEMGLSRYLGVFAIVALVSLAACYIPASRAAKIDPVETLRSE